MKEIQYVRVEDVDIPILKTEKVRDEPLGKYGRMKKRYLKEHQQSLYFSLLAEGILNDYLYAIDQQANEMFERLVEEYKSKRGITEQLKAREQLLWVQEMNNIKSCVDEVIINELLK